MPQYKLSSAYDQQNIVPVIGMLGRPMGHSYPDLVPLLLALYQDHLASVDWLPLGWWDSVNGLMPGAEGAVLVPAGAGTALAPSWLDTPDKTAFWADFSTTANNTINTFLANLAAKGQAELDDATATADFWDTVYNDTAIVASPVTVVKNLAQGAVSLSESVKNTLTNNPFLSSTALLGVGGLILYFALFHHPTVRLAKNPPRRRARRR